MKIAGSSEGDWSDAPPVIKGAFYTQGALLTMAGGYGLYRLGASVTVHIKRGERHLQQRRHSKRLCEDWPHRKSSGELQTYANEDARAENAPETSARINPSDTTELLKRTSQGDVRRKSHSNV